MTFLPADANTTREPATALASVGYVCKRCLGPAPTGVGYVSNNVPADDDRVACDCGYSIKPLA